MASMLVLGGISDNRSFSPRDYQIELLSQAKERNVIICLSSKSAKEFVALKLIQELGHELRQSDVKNRKTTLFITNSITAFNLIHYLTDLKVVNINTYNDDDDDEPDNENEEKIDKELQTKFQVIILEMKQCLEALKSSILDLNKINLIIVDDCHCRTRKSELTDIFLKYYNKAIEKPRILGLAGPIHSAACNIGRLGAELEFLESLLKAKAETASDIVTVLRYSSKPVEIICECGVPTENDASKYIRNLVKNQRSYILDHKYDPSEIYADDFKEELENIPDPKEEPLKCIDDFILILDELGVYCADKAALLLIIQIEKLKVKTPYERHYLLLCLVSTTLIQVRSFCDMIFQSYSTEMEKINAYSTPKIFRLLEILKNFKSTQSETTTTTVAVNHTKKSSDNNKQKQSNSIVCKEMIKDFNFDEMNSLVTTTTEKIDKISVDLENLKASVNKINGVSTTTSNKNNRYNNRYKNRRRFFNHRPRYLNHQNEDTLCGLIFCESTIVAKTLFYFLCEISRNESNLKFLNVQYTVDKTANPIFDSKEAENEHRKQEEVLKKFRMHECNILITTSVLEEGFDLPKCNLVLRFDEPTSYRSYVQCKGRARAPNALHVIMVSPKVHENFYESKIQNEISQASNHSFICKYPVKNDSEDVNEIKNDEIERERCVIDEDKINGVNEDLYQAIEICSEKMIDKLAEYMEIDKILIRKCENKEPPISEVLHADQFTPLLKPYQSTNSSDGAQVNLSNAICLLNKYCAKLPSDTFTKLTPLWRCCKTIRNGVTLYHYTIRLPLNSPIKHDIFGCPMPTRTLARRVAAFVACMILHKKGELDDNLQPIGKEGFKAIEEDWQFFELDKADEELNGSSDLNDPRPGTTKRRQYYYKRIALAFRNCRPTTTSKAFLYHINMTLQCPIPEEQNTRGRKIYPPEEATQSFGILTTKKIPKISSFPIFTRSGEVKVSLQLIRSDIILDNNQLEKINVFISYTFTNVLRLRKYLMRFDPEATENSFFVVPVYRDEKFNIEIDWNFLSTIQNSANTIPQYVSDEERKNQPFDYNRFKDSVVMPWYRNQDQPQYFYVAEICTHLSPESSFPGENYKTFREYYFKKYEIEIQNTKQPLLDVDHTSARLNFLTPRYVNRKGVALPTSSEETKRAKRENLEQKQILVPELCTIHPFPASLWRAAVCLPCILYRINALLLADEIRVEVSQDLGVGMLEISNEVFEWPMLDFGWTLADVLKKTREAKMIKEKEDEKLKYDDDDGGDSVSSENSQNAKKKYQKNGEEKSSGEDEKAKKTANDLLEEVDQKAKGERVLEIGTWSNEMAQNIKDDDDSEFDEEDLNMLPRNLEMCSTRNIRYGSPTSWDMPNDTSFNRGPKQFNDSFYPSESDDDYASDGDVDYDDDDDVFDSAGNGDSNEDEYGLKIEFKNDHLAEGFESEASLRRQKKLEQLNNAMANEKNYEILRNQQSGFDFIDESPLSELESNIKMHEKLFKDSIIDSKQIIKSSGILIRENEKLPANVRHSFKRNNEMEMAMENLTIFDLVPYAENNEMSEFQAQDALSIHDLFKFNANYQSRHSNELFEVIGCGDIFDHFSDRKNTKIDNESGKKCITLNIENNDIEKMMIRNEESAEKKNFEAIMNSTNFENSDNTKFSFDHQPDLNDHPGPSPSILLQGLTMSNANDGINLERLETIGDSFLKYAITTYLYCTYENVNEGKLSYLRSKQVSNLNLYRLGRKKILGESMIATKFEPQDNWLPPCYFVPKELEQALIDAKIPVCYWNLADLPDIKSLSSREICKLVKERAEKLKNCDNDFDEIAKITTTESKNFDTENGDYPCFIPYNLVTQHSIPDKSIADCVEALIGAYLIDCGARGALLFMAWLGIRVLPIIKVNAINNNKKRIPGSTKPFMENGEMKQIIYGYWIAPKTPLQKCCIPDAEETLNLLLDGFDRFEDEIGYHFKDRSYLLQAMTHASYTPNRLTDCYQRLEFLGDAVLDYLITRHLYEDPRLHSPGSLTDLRSALVNNTIFASLAVRHEFHKYFRHLSPALNEVVDRFVQIQHENGHCISEEYYLLSEDECNESEDVEVPKALGDIFESVAGAIFLDSNMSLDAVWRVYYKMMAPEIEQFSRCVPKSPIRELLELEPETAKFGKPEKLADGRRVRVTVEVFGKGIFRGIGRNYRIAKCTAAKCALRQLKKNNLSNKK